MSVSSSVLPLVPIDECLAAVAEYGLPQQGILLLRHLYTTLVDGRNASHCDEADRRHDSVREHRDYQRCTGAHYRCD
jgi:hypothetical protein